MRGLYPRKGTLLPSLFQYCSSAIAQSMLYHVTRRCLDSQLSLVAPEIRFLALNHAGKQLGYTSDRTSDSRADGVIVMSAESAAVFQVRVGAIICLDGFCARAFVA